MDKKKILKIGIIALGIILLIALCVWLISKKDNNEEVIKAEPLNQKVNLEQVFAEIEKIEGMEVYEDIEEPEENEMIENTENSSKIEIIPEDEIDFGKYNVLERKAIVHTTDNEVNEVWMVKLSDYSQQEDIMRIFGNRIQKLRKGFEESGDKLGIVNNAVIKQEDGIVIMIASTNADEIEKTIASEME